MKVKKKYKCYRKGKKALSIIFGIIATSALMVEVGANVFKSDKPTVNTEQEQQLIKLQFDKKEYPDNIVNLGNGKYTLTDSDKKLINENSHKMKMVDLDGKELEVESSWQKYSKLDNLGRSGEGTAFVTYQGVLEHSSQKVKRQPFKSTVKVSGEYLDGSYDALDDRWKGTKRNNKIVQQNGYKGYLYNKSHTIAWSLGGNMETENVTLGTRSQNVGKNDGYGGMAYVETLIRETIKKNKNMSVYYKVKPTYLDKELVPRGSVVQAFSTTDNGKTVNVNIWVFNAEDGFKLNYKDGSWIKENE